MRVLGSLWAATLLAAILPAGAATLYSVENLGALGAGSAQVTGISNAGIVTGYVTNSLGDTVPTCFVGCSGSLSGIGQANAVNATGTIVGTTYAGGNPYVTVWANGSQTIGVSGYGTGVNASGTVAGGYVSPNGQLHAFTQSNGSLTDLGTLPGGTQSSAYGINDAGHVVGTSLANGIFQAFFSTGSGMKALPGFTPGGSSYAEAINGSDLAVGAAETPEGWLHATEWADGAPVDLGTLGGNLSYAYGINSGGAIVGDSYLSDNATEHAFLFTNGVMIDLNNLLPLGSDWTINYAYGIDDAGEIAAMGTRGGQEYALELDPTTNNVDVLASVPTPVPEPDTLLLGGLGILLLLAFFAKRKAAKINGTRPD